MNVRGGDNHWRILPNLPFSDCLVWPGAVITSTLPWTTGYIQTGVWDLLRGVRESGSTFYLPSVAALGSNVVSDVIRHHKPQHVPYNAASDHGRFGSLLGGIGRALAILSASPASDQTDNPVRTIDNETGVVHGSSTGEVFGSGSQFFHTRANDHELPNGLGFLPHWVLTNGWPYTIDTNAESYNMAGPKGGAFTKRYHLTDLAELLAQSAGQDVKEQLVHPWVWRWGIHESVWSLDGTVFTFRFVQDIKTTYGTSDTWYKSRVSQTWTVDLSPVMRLEPGQNIFTMYGGHLPIEFPMTYDLLVTRLEQQEGSGPRPGGMNVQGHLSATNFTYYHTPMALYGTGDIQPTIDKTVGYMQSLDRICSLSFRDIYDSAYVAASSAIVDHEKFLESNYLESISEIDELFALFPDKQPLLDFLNLLPQGKLIAGTIRLLDFVSDAYLIYKFGASPAYRDIVEFATKYDQIADRLRERLQSAPRDLRGKFTYTFTEGPLNGFKLVTRSKVVIRFPQRSISSALLPASSVGLSPTPSSLWQLIPFSFVVDWFTNNTKRWELGEGAVRAMTAVVFYTVHSYTLHFEGLVDDDQEIFFSDRSAYKYYVRLPSAYFPGVPRTSRYDWLAPTSGLNLKIAGALLWSTIR